MTPDGAPPRYELVVRGEIGDHFALCSTGSASSGSAATPSSPVRWSTRPTCTASSGGSTSSASSSCPSTRCSADEGTAHDPAATPDTIVLVHGFWVTPRSWEDWIAHYEARGFRVLAPAYPGFEVEVEALNADPSPIEAVTVPQIIEHLEAVVRASSGRR